MEIAQSKEIRSYPGPTEIDTVQDLIDFLTSEVSRVPAYRNEEVFVRKGKKYYQVLSAKVTDDTFEFGLDDTPSTPFSHEE